jgi:hypothetical protein
MPLPMPSPEEKQSDKSLAKRLNRGCQARFKDKLRLDSGNRPAGMGRRLAGQVFRPFSERCVLKGLSAIISYTEGHKGHEDRSFEQELTEEQENNFTQFLASGCKSFCLCCLPFLLFNHLP